MPQGISEHTICNQLIFLYHIVCMHTMVVIHVRHPLIMEIRILVRIGGKKRRWDRLSDVRVPSNGPLAEPLLTRT